MDEISLYYAVGFGERTRPACCARRLAEHKERSTNSISGGLPAVVSVGETPTVAAEMAALPISTVWSRLSADSLKAFAHDASSSKGSKAGDPARRFRAKKKPSLIPRHRRNQRDTGHFHATAAGRQSEGPGQGSRAVAGHGSGGCHPPGIAGPVPAPTSRDLNSCSGCDALDLL